MFFEGGFYKKPPFFFDKIHAMRSVKPNPGSSGDFGQEECKAFGSVQESVSGRS